MPEKNEALSKAHQRLAARFGKGDRVGGMRRKRKTVHRAATADDKRLQSTLKGLKMTNIPAVEEVSEGFTNKVEREILIVIVTLASGQHVHGG